MEDEATKAQVEGKQENQSSASEATGKRPFVDNPSSSSAATVMDDPEYETEKIDTGKNHTRNGGYYLRFGGNTMHVVGKRPPPVMRRWGPGPPPPKALTYKRMTRRMAETGLGAVW